MGNTLVSPCFPATSAAAAAAATAIKLIFAGGTTRFLPAPLLAAQLMLQFPNTQICHADSFFIGQPVPALSLHDALLPGETYFVLPADLLPSGPLTASSLALLSSSKGRRIPFGRANCPFEFVKRADGKAHVRVLPEFIEGIIGNSPEMEELGGDEGVCEEICSTPELRKQYEQLVGSKGRPWSPRLETITESGFKVRMSPGGCLRCDKFR